LARINSDGTLHGWDPRANNIVRTLALSGSTVYVGGLFTSLSPNGGTAVTRNRLAAVDAGTGAVITAWDPRANDRVNTLAVSGSTVYVGGFFTSLSPNGGTSVPRNHLAALNASTGVATSWNPNSSNAVWILTEQSGTIYAGGDFISIGGDVRNNLAAVDVSTGQLTTWNPNADNIVYALTLSGTTLYAGGNFSNIGGQNRSRIAAINTTDGTATDWNPNVPSGTVRAIALGGSTV
jgi:WD40 repeat protein